MVYDSVYEANKYFRVPTIPVLAPTLESDFSSSAGWSQQGTEIAINTGTGKLDWIGLRSSTNTGISYDFGAGIISTSKWRLEFDLYIQNFSGSSYTQRFGWMLSTKGSADDSDQLRDFIGGRVSYRGQAPTSYQEFNTIDDQGSTDTWADNPPDQPAHGTDAGVTPVAGTTYNIVLTRDSPTAYTMTISSGGTLLDTLNYTSYTGTSDLRYLLIQRYGDGASAGSSFNGTIDNLKFYNGVTTPTPAHPDVRRQHFWENFSGSKLQEGVTGTNSYSTDFPNSTGWLSTGGATITNNELQFATATNGSNTAISYDLGSTQSNSWTLRAKVRYNTQGHNSVGYAHGMIFGLSSAPYTTSSESAQDFIGSTAMHDNIDRAQGAVWADGTKLTQNNTCSGSDGTYGSPVTVAGTCNPSANQWGANTTRWVEIKRTGALTATVSYYPDANYTTPTATRIIPITTEPTGLRYISFRNLNPSRTESGGETIIVDDLSFTSDTIGGIRWRTNKTTGNTGTATMNDTVDGGLKIYAGNSGADMTAIDFNDKRQFSPTASTCIVIGKTTASKQGGWGMLNTVSSGIHGIKTVVNSVNTDPVRLYTSDGSTESAQTSTSFLCSTAQASFNTYQMLLASSNAYLSINGVLEATKSNNMPTLSMQPFAYARLSLAYTYVRYMECYNT